MHKVMNINEFVATRTVVLKNESSGHIDKCFDDSALVSMTNFDFMKVGESYNCFISLFGDVADKKDKDAVRCKIISKEVIGNKDFLKVLVGTEYYYVPKYKIKEGIKDEFMFNYTRKDLIKVNEVIHNDLFRDDLYV